MQVEEIEIWMPPAKKTSFHVGDNHGETTKDPSQTKELFSPRAKQKISYLQSAGSQA